MKPIKQALGNLINERNHLTNQPDTMENKKKLDDLSQKIHEFEAKEIRDKLVKNFKEFSDNPKAINMQQICGKNSNESVLRLVHPSQWLKEITKEK